MGLTICYTQGKFFYIKTVCSWVLASALTQKSVFRNSTKDSYGSDLFVALAVTSSVHACLRNLYNLICFPLSHPPSDCRNPRTDFLRPFHNEGKTHKIKTTPGENTSAAKPNQALCLFTLPAGAVCLRINRLRLRWMVRIQGISWCPDTQRLPLAPAVSHTHTERSRNSLSKMTTSITVKSAEAAQAFSTSTSLASDGYCPRHCKCHLAWWTAAGDGRVRLSRDASLPYQGSFMQGVG